MRHPSPPLLLDENIHGAVTEGLRRQGLDAIHVTECGLEATSDAALLERAAQEDRILVTRDNRDFLELAAFRIRTGLPMPGVLLIPSSLPEREPGRLIRAIVEWADHDPLVNGAMPGGIRWLRAAPTDPIGGQVRESPPHYVRTLARLRQTAAHLG